MHIPPPIVSLIEKYLAGNITAEERLQLNEWYQTFPGDENAPGISPQQEEEMSARLEARILESIEKYKQQQAIPFNGRKLLYMAAAFIVLLVSFGIYRYFFNIQLPQQPIVQQTNNQPKNDIEPGGNKALLTLSDGTTIVLDSAANGTLSQQGNIKVLKLNNGQLSYNGHAQNSATAAAPVFNSITTPRGGQYQVTLSDGTKVWLNAESSLRFPVVFAGGERKVFITGEAYFEVAHNAAMPFRVATTTSEIEVLGTHFNVNAYADEAAVKTTLLEGKVKITATQTANTQTLLPGQQSAISKEGKISIQNNADTNEAIAWMHGNFQFKSANLHTVLRQIARWYDVEIVYNGDVQLHFTGQLPMGENASAIFEKLAMTGEVQFKIEDRKIIVSP